MDAVHMWCEVPFRCRNHVHCYVFVISLSFRSPYRQSFIGNVSNSTLKKKKEKEKKTVSKRITHYIVLLWNLLFSLYSKWFLVRFFFSVATSVCNRMNEKIILLHLFIWKYWLFGCVIQAIQLSWKLLLFVCCTMAFIRYTGLFSQPLKT